jgi:hypothetical protein
MWVVTRRRTALSGVPQDLGQARPGLDGVGDRRESPEVRDA